MNEDNYVEWLVKRKDPAYALPVKALLIIVCVMSLLLALQTVLGIIVLTLACVASYFIFISLSVEYEYLFAEGGLRVDRIMSKSRRRKEFDCDKDDVQLIAPADSYVLKDYETSGMKVLNCASGRKDASVYALIYQKGSLHTKVLFEPNEKMLNAMYRSYPRKVVR